MSQRKARKWTPDKLERLRAEYPLCLPDALADLAASMGVTLFALQHRASALQLRCGRFWRPEELEAVREGYSRGEAVAAIAKRLGRPVKGVYDKAYSMGLYKDQERQPVTDADLALLRELNASGNSDATIATALGRCRETISRIRRRMGLPSQANRARSARGRQIMARLYAAGVGPRKIAYQRFARESGWPEDLCLREVRLLNALAATGVPMTRRQILERMGYEDALTCSTVVVGRRLSSKQPGGSILVVLGRRGLVARIKGAIRGPNPGSKLDLYCLGPEAIRLLEERSKNAAKEADPTG